MRPYKIIGTLKQSGKHITRYPLSLEAMADQRERWWNSRMYNQIAFYQLVDGEYREGIDAMDWSPMLPEVDPVEVYQYGEW